MAVQYSALPMYHLRHLPHSHSHTNAYIWFPMLFTVTLFTPNNILQLISSDAFCRNNSQVFYKANKICLYTYTFNNTQKSPKKQTNKNSQQGDWSEEYHIQYCFRDICVKLYATDFSFLHSFSNMFLKTMLNTIFFIPLAHLYAYLIVKMIQCSSINI